MLMVVENHKYFLSLKSDKNVLDPSERPMGAIAVTFSGCHKNINKCVGHLACPKKRKNSIPTGELYLMTYYKQVLFPAFLQ